MFGLSKIGMGELVLILGIALVIFGPTKLPELGKSMGETIRAFRTSMDKDNRDTLDEKDLAEKKS